MLSGSQRTLLALLALSSVAQAGWFEDTLNEIARRQNEVESSPSLIPTVSPIITPSSSQSQSSSTAPSTTSSPTPSPSSTSSSPSESPSSSSTTTTTSTTASSTTSSSVVSSITSTRPTSTTSSPSVTPSPSVIRVTATTVINGSLVTSVSESTSMVTPTSSSSAELNQNNDSSSGGMSPKTRSTVIGVVVGVGGAILLGGLAVVAWRIWGRKKNADDVDDYDYGRPETAVKESSHSSTAGTANPFQSTLENYHNPAKVNPSANF